MLKENDPILFTDPNKYAPRPFCEFVDNIALVHGYQDFILTPHSINLSTASTVMLQAKHQLIKDYLRPKFFKAKLPDLSHQDVLDLGGNGGFYSYWSVLQGAKQAISIDLDTKYINIVNKVSEKLGFNNVTSVECQVSDWNEPADIVLALAMVHWLYSCTEIYGSLDQVIGKLASLTKNILIVEWVEPSDSAIEFFHHIEWNTDFIQGPYTLEAFEQALSKHFAQFEVIGQVATTRTLYAATVNSSVLELGGPMDLLQEPNTLISSHFLTNVNGVDYWSRVYKTPDKNHIIKQSSLDLAEREYWFLSWLSSDYFPKVYSCTRREGYSIVEMEHIDGIPLLKALPKLQENLETITSFFQLCLVLLEELQNLGITHRDISAQNIILRNNKPVLLDFGWAEAPGYLVDTCGVMGGEYHPLDTVFCDIYAMGKVFKKINQGLYPQLDKLIAVMIEENRSLRITNSKMLQTLLNLIVKDTTKMSSAEKFPLSTEENQLSELADYLYKYNQQLYTLKTELSQKQKFIDDQTETIEVISKQFSALQAQISALQTHNNRAEIDEQTLASWKEQAVKNYQALQALQASRTVRLTKFLGNKLTPLKGVK